MPLLAESSVRGRVIGVSKVRVFSTLMCVRRSSCHFCGLSQFTALKVYSHLQAVSLQLPSNSPQHKSSASTRPVFKLSLACHVHSQLLPLFISSVLPRSPLLPSPALLQYLSGLNPDFSVKLSSTLAFLDLF